MKAKLLHALLAAAVTGGAAFGAGRGVELLPEGRVRDGAQAWLLEPGRRLAEEAGDSRALRKARKEVDRALDRAADRLAGLYTTGAWAALGFVVCLLGVLFFGVTSVTGALALGAKVSLFFFFLQGALVLGAALLLK